MLLPLVASLPAHAHGIAGNRVFPATIATDDPSAASEASLPTVTFFNTPTDQNGNSFHETDVGGELDVLVAPNFAIGASDAWTSQTKRGVAGNYGYQNLEVSGKYQFYTNDAEELIISGGIVAEVGGTGAARVGSDDSSTITPTLYIGKGMNDFPDSMALLRPLAVTATIGYAVPQSKDSSQSFQPGIAVEYSMPYLKSAVHDYDLPEFVNHLIPVVEFPLSLNTGTSDSSFSGSANPGIIYEGNTWQFGFEAVLPFNNNNQRGAGVIGQFHVYLDDLMPAVFGQPLFGGK
jgi:hypothetical protein